MHRSSYQKLIPLLRHLSLLISLCLIACAHLIHFFVSSLLHEKGSPRQAYLHLSPPSCSYYPLQFLSRAFLFPPPPLYLFISLGSSFFFHFRSPSSALALRLCPSLIRRLFFHRTRVNFFHLSISPSAFSCCIYNCDARIHRHQRYFFFLFVAFLYSLFLPLPLFPLFDSLSLSPWISITLFLPAIWTAALRFSSSITRVLTAIALSSLSPFLLSTALSLSHSLPRSSSSSLSNFLL